MAGILRAGSTKLWTPSNQVKPNGIPKINWSHPLAANLVSYWFDTGFGIHVDLVTGDYTTANPNTTGTFPAVRQTSFGSAGNFTGTADTQSRNKAGLQNLAQPYSFAMGWYQFAAVGGSAGNTLWFSQNDNVAPTTGIGFICTVTTNVEPQVANNNLGTGFTPAVNSFNVFVVAANGATSWPAWCNGKLIATGTTTTAFTAANTMFYSFNDGHFGGPNAVFFFGAVWNGRALTITEAQLLYTQPYCFLLPQESSMPALFVSVADVLSPQIWM